MHPQISTTLPTIAAEDPGSWQHLIDRAIVADAAGVDRLVMSDHVAFGEALEEYADPSLGGIRGGQQPTSADGYWLEPLTTISHLAAVTTRVRFGTGILLAALRRPVVLAKMVSTLDVLSGGRFDLGVGVGWQRAEYDAAGLDFGRRGRLLDHSLEVCQSLWQHTAASYESDELSFDRVHQMPKPLQEGGVPIWVSGTVQPRSMRRLARFGSGWIPWGDDAQDLAGGIDRMREAVSALGRDASDIQVVGGLGGPIDIGERAAIEQGMVGVPALLAAGVTDVRAQFAIPGDRDEATDRLTAAVEHFQTLTR